MNQVHNSLNVSNNFVQHYKRLHHKINILEKENLKLQKRHERSSENNTTINNNDCKNLTIEINSTIEYILSKKPYSRYGKKRIKNIVSQAIIDKNLLNGLVHDTLKQEFVKELHKSYKSNI